jgi:hypothetical protein
MLIPVYLIKRHPVAIEAFFEFVLVLTYAFPKSLLEPLLAPGLAIDALGDLGFVAIAMVKTKSMRPKGFPPALGQDFFLVGYRIFTRYTTAEGRTLRGLRILRSDADRSFMVNFGNLLTHYRYHQTNVSMSQQGEHLKIECESVDRMSDLTVTANLGEEAWLPDGSPFLTIRDALKFAGPMPFTFDYERETDSIVRVEGVRQNWHPRAVATNVERLTFFDQKPFDQASPIFCSAFYLKDVPYWWKPGIVERVKRNG